MYKKHCPKEEVIKKMVNLISLQFVFQIPFKSSAKAFENLTAKWQTFIKIRTTLPGKTQEMILRWPNWYQTES